MALARRFSRYTSRGGNSRRLPRDRSHPFSREMVGACCDEIVFMVRVDQVLRKTFRVRLITRITREPEVALRCLIHRFSPRPRAEDLAARITFRDNPILNVDLSFSHVNVIATCPNNIRFSRSR